MARTAAADHTYRPRKGGARPHAAEGARPIIRDDELEVPGLLRSCRAPSITCVGGSGERRFTVMSYYPLWTRRQLPTTKRGRPLIR